MYKNCDDSVDEYDNNLLLRAFRQSFQGKTFEKVDHWLYAECRAYIEAVAGMFEAKKRGYKIPIQDKRMVAQHLKTSVEKVIAILSDLPQTRDIKDTIFVLKVNFIPYILDPVTIRQTGARK